MFRELKESLQSKVFYLAWLCLHIVYQIFIEIRDVVRINWKHFKSRLWSCFPLYSQERELVNFIDSISKLSKVPKHLAISVIPESSDSVLSVLLKKVTTTGKSESDTFHKKHDDSNKKNQMKLRDSDEVDLPAVAKLVSWASAANISVISLYDYNGVLKARYKELGYCIQEEVVQDFWAVKQCRESEKPPVLKIHNVHKSNGYTNGVNGVQPHEALHLFLYSRTDGKPILVQAVKDLSSERKSLSSSFEDTEKPVPKPTPDAPILRKVDERKLDSYLNRYYKWSNAKIDIKTEPDLLLVLGNVKSTLGFLPWHIRLTEIHWLPSLKRLELSDFQESLMKYSRCQQRIGT